MIILTNFFPDDVILELFEIVKPSILASENRGKKAKYHTITPQTRPAIQQNGGENLYYLFHSICGVMWFIWAIWNIIVRFSVGIDFARIGARYGR